MGRTKQPVTAAAIQKKLSRIDGMHAVGGVSGLYLYVRGTSRLWVLRYSFAKKRRDMTLGHFNDCSLEEARERALATRQKIRGGTDPLTERHVDKTTRVGGKTFRECAEAYIKAQEPGWKNAKHGQQWRNTLATYVYPSLGDIQVSAIETANVMAILEGIWVTKNETASRIRGRIESILDWAAVHKYRAVENPARWKGHLALLLAPRTKVQKADHHAALPYVKASDFMTKLREMAGNGARGLEFLILCASRSNEVRNMTWTEVDLRNRVWVIPAERMKGGREHRVPLSDEAIAVLERQPRTEGTDLVYPGARTGTTHNPMSDMTLTAVLRRMGHNDITVHGFRSTFRDWAAECTHYPNEMAELALAHAVGDKTEAAYRRGDMFEKRRALMQDWANHLGRYQTSVKGEQPA